MHFLNKLDFHALDELTEFLIRKGRKKGLSKEDAEDCAQEVILKSIQRFNKDELLAKIAEQNKDYFKHYVNKAFENRLKNIWRNKRPDRDQSDVFKPLIRPKRRVQELNGVEYTEPNLEDGTQPEPIVDPEQENTIFKKESDRMLKKFIERLKQDLSEVEIKFLELYLQKAEEQNKVIIEEIGRELGLQKAQAHDIKRKIMRKASHLAVKANLLKRLSEIFIVGAIRTRPTDLQPSQFSQNILKRLSPSELETLSRIL